MLEFLKGSKSEILYLFFKSSEQEYYLREIAKKLEKRPSYVQAALNSLVQDGVLKDKRKGNLRLFRLNKNYFLYEEIKNILEKTLGLKNELKNMVKRIQNIECAFVFGAIKHKYKDGTIKLIVIGEGIRGEEIFRETNILRDKFGRKIDFYLYNKEQTKEKLKNSKSFIFKVWQESKIVLKGDLEEFVE